MEAVTRGRRRRILVGRVRLYDGAMGRAGLIFVALCAGCFNHCEYENDRCPSASAVSSLDGRTCNPDADSECVSDSVACVCDALTRRWDCVSAKRDLSAQRDLTVTAACGEYVTCLDRCFQTTINPSVATCEGSCAPSASGDAVLRYAAAVDCGEAHCAGGTDAGATACLRASDGTLLNEDGTPRSPTDPGTGQKRCNLCLHDALAELHGETCTVSGSADCKPAACKASVDACLSN